MTGARAASGARSLPRQRPDLEQERQKADSVKAALSSDDLRCYLMRKIRSVVESLVGAEEVEKSMPSMLCNKKIKMKDFQQGIEEGDIEMKNINKKRSTRSRWTDLQTD